MVTTYVVSFVDEPDEEPLRLTQDDFDLIMDLGAANPAVEGSGSSVFATVTTDPADAAFTWRGDEVDGDELERLFGAGFVVLLRRGLESAKERAERVKRRHDAACPNVQGSCCPWMGDCDCQCLCDFIEQVRRDAVSLSADDLAVVVDCLADAAGWTGGGASTQEHALTVLRKLDPTHPAVNQ